MGSTGFAVAITVHLERSRGVHAKSSYRITWNGTLLVNVALGVVTVT